jgi:type IV pilus assembly protein PilQ
MGQVDFAPSTSDSQIAVDEVQPVAQAPMDPTNAGTLVTDPFSMMANKVYTGKLISLDFQNADIHNILRLIGEVSGKNVVVSDQISGKVTLKLSKVPWDQALDTVLASKNLGVIENGNILRIDTIDAIRRATPDISDPSTRVALVRKIFTPKYASVSSLAGEMDKGKSMRGSVRVIGNDIYVEDDISTIAAITQIFIRNDRVTKQILIEARIVVATNNFTQDLGVRWAGAYDRLDLSNESRPTKDYNAFPDDLSLRRRELLGAIDVNPDGISRLGGAFLNKAGTLALTAELRASEAVGQTRIVSSPRIMASNDQEVYIKQGFEIPYKSGASSSTPSNTEFKDAVMELRVTPHIEENGQIVTLDITLTKDSPTTLSGSSEPAIDKREARTKLMVKDGETVVIGGIISDTQNNTSGRVPGLHNIPLFGWLFQNRAISNNKSEMLIFITANIIPINI